MTSIEREYLRKLDEIPYLASEQGRGLFMAICDNISVQLRRENPALSGKALALAVARRLHASDSRTMALLDKVNITDAQ